MSRFAEQTTALLSRLDVQAAEEIVYEVPDDDCELYFKATPGRTDFEDFDADGQPTTITSKDWLFHADELRPDGTNFIVPQEGHRIRWTDGESTTHVYRVLPFGVNREVFRWSDEAQTRLRVHTKRMTTE